MASSTDSRKSVLITGCSPGGIGHSLSHTFHKRGLRVFATARDRSKIADLEAVGIETLDLVVDDLQSVQACFTEIESRVGSKGLDYLVNNAGRNYTVPAMEVDLQEARAVFETNFFAVITMCQKFLPLLMKAKGTVVQIGSVSGIVPYVFGSVYNASKAALHSFSDTLRIELEPFDVKVIVVVTGGVQSQIAREDRQLLPNSIYQPIMNEYHRRVKHSQEGAMNSDAYARSVVSQVLGSTSSTSRWYRNWIWEGNRTRMIKFLAGGWLWFGFYGWFFRRMFNLNKLRAKK
ncbi:hypothetical protein BGW36DRAFT_375350 [Talaromyces proteolyticus]|uniref:Short chain dehydrogenase/reductase n=1 Tax=Talaromyces proteolyticus TaxID=1131652 RepID=A0AAD4Q327_9EURO|nr:uncharacterized protein BGW36DRAFT_375350 [Talaromyces proteolyticus]KAH8700986.1 hypothetical protein BGW36DRAFT_375350 [Talaromyces proteolyticus]